MGNMVLKHVKFFFIFLIYSFNVNAQYLIEKTEKERVARNDVKVKTEWEHSISNGKVDDKGTKTSVTEFDNHGNEMSKLIYRFNGDTSSFERSKYDSKGNIIEFTKYDGRKKMFTIKKFIKYDPKGNKVNERGMRGNAGDYSNYYKYDSDGELSEIYYYSSNAMVEKRVIENIGKTRTISIYNGANQLTGKITKTFDDNGNLIEETEYTSADNVKKDYKYEYDGKGNVLEEEQQLYGKLNLTKKFSYDNSGNLVKIVHEKSDGKTFTNNIYKYDSWGLLVEEQWYNESKDKYSTKKYKYSNTGNLIEADCYFAQFNSQYVYKYQYEKY